MTEVIVKLGPEAQRDRVLARAAELHVSLEPLHPATDEPELDSYLMGRVEADADTIAERLLHCDGVEAAYAKPPGAPPERSADDVP